MRRQRCARDAVTANGLEDFNHEWTRRVVTAIEGSFCHRKPYSALQSLEIVHFLEDSSRIPQHLCRAVYADTPIRRYADTPTRRHADTVVIFGCASAALSLCACAKGVPY
jgi:hypothetical protein